MCKKYLNKIFIYLICFFISYIYLVNIKIVWIDMVEASTTQIAYIGCFSLITFLLVWCLFQTMFTDPGKVPQNWGFFLDVPEQRQRKFCLTCHIFKPERCHHCSACNRCVLNMDHHCPWINNCVGFQNRKYFMQMLFYTIIDSFIAILGLIKGVMLEYQNIMLFFQGKGEGHFLAGFLLIIALGLSVLSFSMITSFFKFHIDLVLSNRTTIENLERKRNEETGQPYNDFNQYDIKAYFNWVQVFGTNKLLWFLPIPSADGRPVGDGILWPKKQKVQSNIEVMSSPANQQMLQQAGIQQIRSPPSTQLYT